VIWSLASELGGHPAAVAMVFPCGAGRVLEIAGMAGDAVRFFDAGPSPNVKRRLMHLARKESVAASLLVIAQRIASAPLN
jgi:hypothetical protein